jgi:hypothetical protein
LSGGTLTGSLAIQGRLSADSSSGAAHNVIGNLNLTGVGSNQLTVNYQNTVSITGGEGVTISTNPSKLITLNGNVNATKSLNVLSGISTRDITATGNLSANTANFNTVSAIEYDVTGTDGMMFASKDIKGWAFGSTTTPVLTSNTSPQAVFFKPDGSVMYVLESQSPNQRVYAYNVPTPWNVSTVSATPTLSSVSVGANIQGLYFSPDGRYFFTLITNKSVNRYIMPIGSEWNVSTGVLSGTFTIPLVVQTVNRGITFKPDGTEMYVVDDNTNAVYQYSLSAAWDVTTAVSGPTSPSLLDGFSDITISSDGRRLIMINSVLASVYEYTLPTPWSLTGIFLNSRMYRGTTSTVFPAGGPVVTENAPTGIYYNDVLNKCFFIGTQQRRVQEIDVTPQPAIVGTRPIIYSNSANSVADRVTMNSLYITDTAQPTGTTTGALLVAGGIAASGVNSSFLQSPLIEATTTDSGFFSLQFRASIRTAGSGNNGFIRLGNQTGTDFERLIFGPFTNAYPAIRKNQTVGVVGLDIITATNSDFADLRAKNITGDNFIVLNNIVTQAADFTLSGIDAGKYTRLAKLSGTQTITLTSTSILQGHEFTFYRATSAAIALNGGIVNGGTKIASVAQYDSFGLKHLGSGTFDFI